LRTIAILNQKGGVGKTTTTVNVAAALADAGRKVIVIDLDPQAHLTIHLGVEPQTVQAGAYEVLTQSADFAASLTLVRPNLWLLAANIDLVGAETELVNVVGREIILREAMQASQDAFDFCLIDCPPSLSVLSLNALAASQETLIPLQPHFLALQGFGKLLQTIDLVNKRINPRLKVTGVLLCMNDTRASLSNEVRADIDSFLQSARGTNSAWSDAEILPAYIRRNIKLAEAPSYGQTIFEYDPTCNGAEDYRKVARFLLGINETPPPEPTLAAPPVEATSVAAPVEPTPAAATVEPTAPGAPPEAQGDSPALVLPPAAVAPPAENAAAIPSAEEPVPLAEPDPAVSAVEFSAPGVYIEAPSDSPASEPPTAGVPVEAPSDSLASQAPAAVEPQVDTPAPGPQEQEPVPESPPAAPAEPPSDSPAPLPPATPPIPIVAVDLPAPHRPDPVPSMPKPAFPAPENTLPIDNPPAC